MRVTRRKSVRVPWLELARSPAEYLDASTIPNDFKLLDPSKMTKYAIDQLWWHWTRRAEVDQPILVFAKGRKQDMGTPPANTDPRPYTINALEPGVDYIPIDEDPSDEAPDSHARKRSNVANEGEGSSGSQIRPPPSKRPRLSGQAAIDKDSPAANSSNRPAFLSGLSLEPSFRTLIDTVLALPASVSFVVFICEFV